MRNGEGEGGALIGENLIGDDRGGESKREESGERERERVRRRTGEIRAWACSRVSVARWNGCRDRLAAGERDCRCAPAPAPASAAASRAASSSPAWAMVTVRSRSVGMPYSVALTDLDTFQSSAAAGGKLTR